ncbi:MAG TPA: molybdopterin-guanine dinucleotide biosynthesis protein B [Gammaproteobacteria bacterium]|nr:molybdopterin-guanine dinucleotide biosynthesis protein B [Gammaproteobacteria bacterium]
MPDCNRPLLGFAAYSGTGKTTLLEQLIPLLRQQGLRIALIKHAHHAFDIDQPGKDSYRLREAGASQVLIASSQRSALITENAAPKEPRLEDLLSRLDTDQVDLVLVEGFRHVRFAKIELHRQALDKPWLHTEDDSIIAIASDLPAETNRKLPQLDLNQPGEIVSFIMKHFNL